MWKLLGRNYGHCWKLESGCGRKQCLQSRISKSSIRRYSNFPPPTKSSNSGRIILGIAGTSILIGGGTIVAAKFSSEFRKRLEETIPYSDNVLASILGKDDDIKLNIPAKPIKENVPIRSNRQQTEFPLINKKTAPVTATQFSDIKLDSDVNKSKSTEVVSATTKEEKIIEVASPVPSASTSNVMGGELDQKNQSLIATSENISEIQTKIDDEKERTEEISESNKLKNQFELELDRQEQEINKLYREKKEYKEELLKQLKRQALFHSEYLRAVLQTQRNELKSEFEDLYQDRINEAKLKVQEDLASYIGELKGIKDELNDYVESHSQWTTAKKLWVGCWALKRSCDPVNQNESSSDVSQPLGPIVDFLTKIGSDDKFINVVIQAIPDEALKVGVYSKEALTERFFKLDNMCRRVVLIGESGENLFKYASSYVQSLLMGSRNLFRTLNASDEPVDISSNNMFDILDHAKWYILQGNLETAVRYVNLLHGTPRKVAQDWLKDARTYLEVSQVADVLIARSGATDVLSV